MLVGDDTDPETLVPGPSLLPSPPWGCPFWAPPPRSSRGPCQAGPACPQDSQCRSKFPDKLWTLLFFFNLYSLFFTACSFFVCLLSYSYSLTRCPHIHIIYRVTHLCRFSFSILQSTICILTLHCFKNESKCLVSASRLAVKAQCVLCVSSLIINLTTNTGKENQSDKNAQSYSKNNATWMFITKFSPMCGECIQLSNSILLLNLKKRLNGGSILNILFYFDRMLKFL